MARVNFGLEPLQLLVVLGGELSSPSSQHRHHGAKPLVHAVMLGWFGKTVAMLAMLAIFATAFVLAAAAVLIFLPLAIIGAA